MVAKARFIGDSATHSRTPLGRTILPPDEPKAWFFPQMNRPEGTLNRFFTASLPFPFSGLFFLLLFAV
jgi:hypothetical protein